eukprot:g5477.t2
MTGKERRAGGGKDDPGAAAFRVQSQIRRNAQDMQEYLTELGSWEKSIKKKDRQLSRKATARSSSSSHSTRRKGAPYTGTPPIRPAGDAVPVSSGPAPRGSESTNKGGTDSEKGGAAGTRQPREVRAGGNKGAAGGSSGESKAKPSCLSAAGHTYDKGYSKWDKFDIDAAMRSVDEEEDGGTDEKRRKEGNNVNGSDRDTDDDETQDTPRLTPATMVERSASQGGRRPPPPKAAAPPPVTIPPTRSPGDLEKEERERGNAKFGQGDFEGAVKCYTRCVGMNSKSSLAFSNRAMSYLKLKEFGKAEADCDSALRLDPRHVKSLQRRATARNALGKHRAALADLQTAAEIDQSSKQVRKDLSKTLETLKTVVRRAPKRQVKVESVPLPAPKPRGYSPPTKTDDARPHPANLASPDLAPDGTAVVAVSATNTSAPVTGSQEETVAPFSSVLHQSRDKRVDGESNVYQARTTVEELPEEADDAPPPAPSPTPVAALRDAAAAAGVSGPALPAAHNSPATQEEEDPATETALASSGTDGEEEEAAAGLTKKNASAGMTRPAAVSETTPAEDGATRSPEAAVLVAAAETNPGRPAVSPAAESDQGDVDAKQASNAGDAGGGENTGSVLREEPHGGETASSSPPLSGRAQAEDKGKAAPLRTVEPTPPTATSPPCSTTHAPVQLPTTGYQFELMWRSTGGSLEARLELLRAVPPSSVSKFFRRTPIEVELLGGVLRGLGEAFLPRKPATALRWLKSLSKACRFRMTVALLGEADGRAAAREVLTRLETAPPAKVDPQDVEVLRKQFLV